MIFTQANPLIGTVQWSVQVMAWHQTDDNPLPATNEDPGPRLNIKTVLSTYGDFHVKDKTAVRTSYL